MRQLVLLAVFALIAPAYAGDDALATVNTLINESDDAAGLHSIDMFSYKLIGNTDEIYADAQCIRMTLYLDRRKRKSKPLCYEHRDITRLVIVPLEKTRSCTLIAASSQPRTPMNAYFGASSAGPWIASFPSFCRRLTMRLTVSRASPHVSAIA